MEVVSEENPREENLRREELRRENLELDVEEDKYSKLILQLY